MKRGKEVRIRLPQIAGHEREAAFLNKYQRDGSMIEMQDNTIKDSARNGKDIISMVKIKKTNHSW